jgi:hypothetical protein
MVETSTNQLEAYGDADFTRDRDELKSITGFLLLTDMAESLHGNPQSRKSLLNLRLMLNSLPLCLCN